MSGPPFSLQVHLTTVKCGATLNEVPRYFPFFFRVSHEADAGHVDVVHFPRSVVVGSQSVIDADLVERKLKHPVTAALPGASPQGAARHTTSLRQRVLVGLAGSPPTMRLQFLSFYILLCVRHILVCSLLGQLQHAHGNGREGLHPLYSRCR